MNQTKLILIVDHNELTTDATIVDHIYHLIQVGLDHDPTTPVVHVEIEQQ